jgi:hypothetical protein
MDSIDFQLLPARETGGAEWTTDLATTAGGISPINTRELRESGKLQMSIVYRRIDQLRPNPENPRRHKKKQVQQIAASIRHSASTCHS